MTGGTGSASTMGDVSRINVPVMLLRHRLDSCRVSAPADADRFKALLTGAPKVDIVTLDGGGPRGTTAEPCGGVALSRFLRHRRPGGGSHRPVVARQHASLEERD